MQVIVLGAGSVGIRICEMLLETDEDVVLIDRSIERLRQANFLDCQKLAGIPLEIDLLEQAGIESCDLICCVTRDDNMNLVVAQIAKNRYQVGRAIVRLDNPRKAQCYKELGIETFCTSEWTAKKLWQLIHSSETIYHHSFFGQEMIYKQIPVEPELLGLKISEVTEQGQDKLIGILRAGTFLLAEANLELQSGDSFVLLSVE
ncbi:MAG: TrkA family potassium uptake protein [Eubacteriales bacterium]|nr:TrkA family potassium uptake protein [Eubacteriales bacterium]